MTHPISFEFFPPRTQEGTRKLRQTRQALYALGPEFCSMTYGAGGSTRAGTFAAVTEMMREGCDAVSHLSCMGATYETMRMLLQRLKSIGVKRLVALRGDLPSGYGAGGEFQYASDLIRFIREETGDHFKIYAACYPEVHPQAETPGRDLDALQAKVEAGADVLITQMFFNADAYFYFLDDLRARGVDLPVIPGIMPITSSTSLMRFASSCGADVPRWMRLHLQSFGDNREAIADFGADVMTRLCERLLTGGAPALHFYTINKAEPTRVLCERLGLSMAGEKPAERTARPLATANTGI